MVLWVGDTFDAAHRLKDCDGKCRHIHGHTWKVEVGFECRPDVSTPALANGAVVDFNFLKEKVSKVVGRLDHALFLEENDTFMELSGTSICVFKSAPTVDVVARSLYKALKSACALDSFDVVKVRLFETPTCFVEVG